MRWLVRNWHLKLAAVALATILYTGLVYSGSFADRTVRGVPIRVVDQPTTAVNIGRPLDTVDVGYRVSRDQPSPTVDSFAASVDVSKYDMQRAGEPQSLPLKVTALVSGIEVLDWTPSQVQVTLDTLDTKTVPVVVDRGTVPPGLEISTPRVTPEQVQIRGPSSRVSQVVRAMAYVSIDSSGIGFSREVDLSAVDVDGQRVESIQLTPNSARVDIRVNAVETSKTVPVRPQLNGSPATGSVIESVEVEPATVTLRGTPAALSAVNDVATEAISVDGLGESKSYTVKLQLPKDALLATAAEATATVGVSIAPATGSRTFVSAVRCRNVTAGTACLPRLGQVAITLSGQVAALDNLNAADLALVLDVSGLGPGTQDVTGVVTGVPDGVELVSASPATVSVVIQAPSTPRPSASATPSPTPAG
jgi:YbbR domain-containing protein